MWNEPGVAQLQDGLLDDDADDGELLASHTADDRAYLLLLYREHAAQARQQETLRSMWTAVATVTILALFAAGLTVDGPGRRGWVCGALVCVASLLGAALNQKHFERYELHLSIMRSFRNMLAHRVRHDIPKITMTATIQHGRQYRLSRRLLGLQGIWRTVYLAAFLAGAWMVWDGTAMTAAPRQAGPVGGLSFMPSLGTPSRDDLPPIAEPR